MATVSIILPSAEHFPASGNIASKSDLGLQAADLYAGEEQTSEANKCRIKVKIHQASNSTVASSTFWTLLAEQ